MLMTGALFYSSPTLIGRMRAHSSIYRGQAGALTNIFRQVLVLNSKSDRHRREEQADFEGDSERETLQQTIYPIRNIFVVRCTAGHSSVLVVRWRFLSISLIMCPATFPGVLWCSWGILWLSDILWNAVTVVVTVATDTRTEPSE